MRAFYLFMAALLAAGFPADTLARTYFLPDYQSEFYSGNRVQDNDSGHHTSTPSCSDYGFYSAPQNNTDCQRVSPPAPGLVCYSCKACSSDYAYDSSNCSGDYVTSGSTCSGKYSKCICDRSKFPVSSGGCPSGQKIDTANSCKGPSDTETYYQCVDDSCYGVILKNACETQGRYCVPSSECPAGCEQCIDRCEGYKSYEGAIECDNGCMNASDQISDCSDLCQAGSTCKPTTCDDGYELSGSTCVPKTCSGYLDACPDNAVCNDTCQSGESLKYKPTGCKEGYTQTGDTCTNADCDGFTLSSCPTGAASCNSCKSGTVTKYQITGCKEGYTQISDTCTNADCDGFTLSSCPSRASCSSCKSGTSTKYKIDQCNPGYELNGSSCKAAACEGYSYSCPSTASSCETCLSGSSTRYKVTACKEGYELNGSSCKAAACEGYSYSCPSTASSCETCLSGTSTKYKVTACKEGYELNDSGSCSSIDCQNKGYSLYSCPSIATDCETCLSGTRTYYRIKSCTIPLAVSSDRKSCICPSNAVVTDEASLRLAFSEKCPIITVSGTINMADSQRITIYPSTTKFTGTNNASLHFSLPKYISVFDIEKSPETPLEISNLDFSVDSGGGLELLQIWNRPSTINNISVNLEGTFDMSTSIINSFYSDTYINNLNVQADINTSSLFSPVEFYNPDDYSRSFSIKNSEIIANNTGDGPVQALRFEMHDNSSSYINIENTTIALNTVERNYAIWAQDMLTSGYIELKASGCSISAKSDFNAAYTAERNDFNSLTYINRAGKFSIVTQ